MLYVSSHVQQTNKDQVIQSCNIFLDWGRIKGCFSNILNPLFPSFFTNSGLGIENTLVLSAYVVKCFMFSPPIWKCSQLKKLGKQHICLYDFIHNKDVSLLCLHEVEIKILLLLSETCFSWEGVPVTLLGRGT